MQKRNKLKQTLRAVIMTGWGLLLCSSKVQAQLVINEVLPYPSTGLEWVELFNNSGETVELNGWSLEDQLTEPSIMYKYNQGIIAAKTYLIVQIPTSKLNNTGDGVTLKNPQGEVVDQMSYSSSQVDVSWARRSDVNGTFTSAAPSPGQTNPEPDPSPTPTVTPAPSGSPTPEPSATASPSPSASPNSTATPQPTPSPSTTPTPTPNSDQTDFPQYPNLQLSEVMACPNTGEPEWLEFFNHSNQVINLINWTIADSAANNRNLNLTINPYSLAVFELSSSLLNNSGDEVNLLNPLGATVISMSYQSCVKGTSLIFADSSWQVSSTPTKGTPNITASSEISDDDLTVSSTPSASLVTSVTSSPIWLSSINQTNGSNCQNPPCFGQTNPFETNSSWSLESLVLGLQTNQAANIKSLSNQSLLASSASRLERVKWGIVSDILGGAIFLCLGGYHLNKIYESSSAPTQIKNFSFN